MNRNRTATYGGRRQAAGRLTVLMSIPALIVWANAAAQSFLGSFLASMALIMIGLFTVTSMPRARQWQIRWLASRVKRDMLELIVHSDWIVFGSLGVGFAYLAWDKITVGMWPIYLAVYFAGMAIADILAWRQFLDEERTTPVPGDSDEAAKAALRARKEREARRTSLVVPDE